MVDNRRFGGGGVAFKIGIDEKSNIQIHAEAAHFLDDYTDNFSRFTGKTSVRFLKYYFFQTTFEYYLQSEYYSNNFSFGLKYYLK